MSENPLRFRWHVLLSFAAIMLVAEIYHVSLRGAPSVNQDVNVLENSTGPIQANPQRGEIVAEFLIPNGGRESSVLVLGNLGCAFDGDLDVTISVTPYREKDFGRHDALVERLNPISHVANSPLYGSGTLISKTFDGMTQRYTEKTVVDAMPQVELERQASGSQPRLAGIQDQVALASNHILASNHNLASDDDKRLYFLQTVRAKEKYQSLQTPIQCRLMIQNPRVRIYVDDEAEKTVELEQLLRALCATSNSRLAQIIEDLVGSVDDIDEDGHLALVLTPALERLGVGATPVKGLTRSSDFVRGMERPGSNQSDVVFLSSKLRPDDELAAILAHEWCHAAVFSRRIAKHSEGSGRADDDWLNEAIAHIVELRATKSWSNLAHRIRDFSSRPQSSPLVVRDYYHSEFWRHDGCRGAAFLFLKWCVEQEGDALIARLLSGRGCTMENLEIAMGKPFSELFRDWTEHLGSSVADQIRGEKPDQNEPVPQFERWDLGQADTETRTIRIRGVSAAFLALTRGAGPYQHAKWRVTVTTSKPAQLQAASLPVSTDSLKRTQP